LHEQGAELLVVACNTATALALEDIQQSLSIPVIGVVQPGAHAAQSASLSSSQIENNVVILSGAKDPRISSESQKKQVLVLATQATVQSHAYTRALAALNLEAREKACPLLVPLVEEGWINHPVTDEVLKIYLREALAEAPNAQTLLLGCTHYPLIEPAIHRVLATLNHPLTVIDSAKATAEAVAAHIAANPSNLKAQNSKPTPAFYATDSIEKFERLGSTFLGQPVTGVRHVDLGG
jgi:glutamate racemase